MKKVEVKHDAHEESVYIKKKWRTTMYMCLSIQLVEARVVHQTSGPHFQCYKAGFVAFLSCPLQEVFITLLFPGRGIIVARLEAHQSVQSESIPSQSSK